MCGIAGIITRDPAALPTDETLTDAARALEHRGPDDSGVYRSGTVALVHTRLSIIDLAGGRQPMSNADGSVVVVFNGEIWNYRTLRAELVARGHSFRTTSDTEVLVHGFEEWKTGLVDHLHGMFAFAIWSKHDGYVFLARDRMGKKPLYLSRTPTGLAFGSDVRAVLLVAGERPRVDAQAVPEFLFQRYVTGPRTLFAGVEKMLPGEALVTDGATTRRWTYWTLPVGDERPLPPGELRSLLQESVRERLMSDVPLGVLLSGGVDSTAIVGLMREIGAEDIATFTIGFDDALYDERRPARVTARQFATQHHEVVVGPADLAAAIPRLAWYRDEPIAEPSEIPLLLLAEFAARQVKVVLSGDGGDELFGGYPKYRLERLLRVGLPAGLAAAAGRVAAGRGSHRQLSRAVENLAVRDPLVRWASWFRSWSPGDLSALLVPELRDLARPEALVAPLRSKLAPYRAVDPGRRMLVGDQLTYLPDNMLLRGDKITMAASLEGRMPLLDRTVVERVNAAPFRQRVGLRAGKALLRSAVADLLPSEVTTQPKRGFQVPIAQLLIDNPLVDRILGSERLADRILFEPAAVQGLLDQRHAPGADHKIFILLSLELWLQANVDELRLTPPTTFEELSGDPDTSALAAA